MALGAAILAGVFARVYLAGLDRRVPVVVAARDFPAYTVLEPSMLKTVLLPPVAVHAKATGQPSSLVGLVTLVPRQAGEQILLSTLVSGENPGEYRASLASDERAMFLPSESVLGGWVGVEEGDYVDLTAVWDDVSRCLAAGLEVLEVVVEGEASGPLSPGRPALPVGAFLRVTPLEAERIALAAESGTLYVTVLGYSGVPVPTSGVRIDELYLLSAPADLSGEMGGQDDASLWP